MTPRRTTTVLTLAMLLAVTAAHSCLANPAPDWPQFRGPGGTAAVADAQVPVTLATNANLAWRAALPGRGLSSPVLVGDRVFVTCASGPRQDRLHVICLKAVDGSPVWERRFWATGRTMCHEKTSVAAPTPASDGQRVLAVFSSGDAFCLDLDGNLLWVRSLGLDYPNASNSLGMSSSPLAAAGVFLVQLEADSDSQAFGLDPETGLTRWRMERPHMANWTSPIQFTNASGRVAVLLQSGKGVTAVEPASGHVVWDYSDGASTVPSSVVNGAVVCVPSRGLTVLEPQEDGQAPRQLWRSAQLRPGTPSPVVFGGRVFTMNDGGILTCGDLADGRRLWQLRLKGPMSASPVAAGRHLYCVSETGLVQVVDPVGAEGSVVCELNLAETVLSTPAIGAGGIYFRSDAGLWKFGSP